MNNKVIFAGFLLSHLNAAISLAAEAKSPPRTLPLSSVVTTGPQKGMERATKVFRLADGTLDHKAYRNSVEGIEQGTHSGASNVFLVDAIKVQDAIKASKTVLIGSGSALTPWPVDTPKPVRGGHWLVAYLGTAPSTPTWWTVESITVSGRTIRVTYRESPPTGTTRDAVLYYYWAPLGHLGPGIYDLELFDAGRNMVSLMRKVEVGSNEDGGQK